jgi:hypothetical protein
MGNVHHHPRFNGAPPTETAHSGVPVSADIAAKRKRGKWGWLGEAGRYVMVPFIALGATLYTLLSLLAAAAALGARSARDRFRGPKNG